MKYYCKNYNQPDLLIAEISKEEYHKLRRFRTTSFNHFQTWLYSYKNYELAKLQYDLLLENSEIELEDIYINSIYPITSMIIYSHTLLEHTDKFNQLLNSPKIKKYIKNLKNVRTFKTLRVLRNYSIHESIPVKSTVQTSKTFNEKEKDISFYINKKTIMQGNINKRDRQDLKTIRYHSININTLLQNVSEQFDTLYELVIDEYIQDIKNVNQPILKHLKSETADINYLPNYYGCYRKENDYYILVDGFAFNLNTLQLLTSRLMM